MAFIEKLNKLMEERGLNKSSLARESGIPYTTIDGFYKKGTDNVKLSTLRKLASYFNCSLDYLADDSVDNQPHTIAAHFDGEEFTAEQIERIKAFAAFIKSEDNK